MINKNMFKKKIYKYKQMPILIEFNYDEEGYRLIDTKYTIIDYDNFLFSLDEEANNKYWAFTRLGFSSDTIKRNKKTGYIEKIIIMDNVELICKQIYCIMEIKNNDYRDSGVLGIANIYTNLENGLGRLYEDIKTDENYNQIMIEYELKDGKLIKVNDYKADTKYISVFGYKFRFIFLEYNNTIICWPNQTEYELKKKLRTYKKLIRYSGDSWQTGCDDVYKINEDINPYD